MYTIHCDVNHGNGFAKYTLAENNRFYLATNNVRKFETLHQAKRWWTYNLAAVPCPYAHEIVDGPLYFVQGPKASTFQLR